MDAGSTELDFDLLFREYASKLRRRLCQQLGDVHLADDVVQETFARAIRARHQYDGRRPVWPWLSSIAANLCVDLKRRSSLGREVLAVVPDRPSLTDDPALAVLRHEQSQAALAALGGLKPRYRRLLVLHELGYSTEELADLERATVFAMKSLITRARHLARARYQAVAGDDWRVSVGWLFSRSWRARVRRVAQSHVTRILQLGNAMDALANVAIGATFLLGTLAVSPPHSLPAFVGATGIAIARGPVASAPTVIGSQSDDPGHRDVSNLAETTGRGHSVTTGAASAQVTVERSQGRQDTSRNSASIRVLGRNSTETGETEIPCQGSLTGSIICGTLARVPSG